MPGPKRQDKVLPNLPRQTDIEGRVSQLEAILARLSTYEGSLVLPEFVQTPVAPGNGSLRSLLFGFAGGAATRIAMIDENGLVLHAFMCISGERAFLIGSVNVTVLIGTRTASATVTHNQNWTSVGQVLTTIQNANALAAAEKPADCGVFTAGVNAFSVNVNLLANAAAQRVVSVGYICVGIV